MVSGGAFLLIPDKNPPLFRPILSALTVDCKGKSACNWISSPVFCLHEQFNSASFAPPSSPVPGRDKPKCAGGPDRAIPTMGLTGRAGNSGAGYQERRSAIIEGVGCSAPCSLSDESGGPGVSDDYLDLDALEQYSCMKKRWWRYQLPYISHLKLPGKILVRRSIVDEYLRQFLRVPEVVDLRGLLDKVIPIPRRRGSKGRFRGEGGG